MSAAVMDPTRPRRPVAVEPTPLDRLGEWLAQPGSHLAIERPDGRRYLAVAYTTASGRRVAHGYGYGASAVEAIEDCALRGSWEGDW